MKLLFLLFSTVTALGAHGQGDVPSVDLTLSDNGKGQVEFRIRTDGYFDGIMSALTFTVRWPASAGIALDTAVRCYPFQDLLPVTAVVPVANDGWMYRTFNGFGMSALADMGQAWQPGREYPISTADLLVPGTVIELSQDEWTLENNRAFYASLNGWDRTGGLYDRPAPDVAIRSEDQGTGNLDIFLTPTEDFFGWVTDLDFTVRWPADNGVSLGAIEQNDEVAEYLPVVKVGSEVTAGGFTYQRFHGEGVKSIANSDDAWHAGVDITALSLPIFGNAPGIMVVNDDWTAANDGDYLIELNGAGHEGTVEGIAMGIATSDPEGIQATVFPRPNGFDLTVELPNTATTATFSLHNAAGQLLWSTTREGAQGRMNLLAETASIPEGLYILSVRHGDRSFTKRVIR